MDVTKHGEQILETALVHLKAHTTSFGHVAFLFALLAVGFTAGTAGISAIERRLRSRRSAPAPIAGGDATAVLSAEQIARSEGEEARRRALQTGMVIAVAIGLHNATEGFGIVGPLGGTRPSWPWLARAGLISGGPTFLGTIVGYQVNSSPLELLFYALAGGAILYVIGEIWTGMRRYGHHTLGLYLVAAGFLAGVATDLIVSYGGG
jgi:ZIP family zinc transporter